MARLGSWFDFRILQMRKLRLAGVVTFSKSQGKLVAELECNSNVCPVFIFVQYICGKILYKKHCYMDVNVASIYL